MLQRQKEVILASLRSAKADRDYTNNFWFSYKDFLDPEDDFTSFSCEDLDGKQGYISLIENLLKADESAKVFVEVYGYEEDHDKQFIYADTLVIFSRLSILEIKQIFNEPDDIFPSDIGELTDFSSRAFVIDDNGDLVPAVNFCDDGYPVYYCWWD